MALLCLYELNAHTHTHINTYVYTGTHIQNGSSVFVCKIVPYYFGVSGLERLTLTDSCTNFTIHNQPKETIHPPTHTHTPALAHTHAHILTPSNLTSFLRKKRRPGLLRAPNVIYSETRDMFRHVFADNCMSASRRQLLLYRYRD